MPPTMMTMLYRNDLNKTTPQMREFVEVKQARKQHIQGHESFSPRSMARQLERIIGG
jgi:hypothetical protein